MNKSMMAALLVIFAALSSCNKKDQTDPAIQTVATADLPVKAAIYIDTNQAVIPHISELGQPFYKRLC